MREQEACLHLLLAWLAERHGRSLTLEGTEEPSPGALAATASDSSGRLAIEAHVLPQPPQDPVWLAARDDVAGRLGEGLDGAYALWVPPGADLPDEDIDDFVRRVRETAESLAPGERRDVALPVPIALRKTEDEGGLVSVSGGLNRHWARLTEGVRGTFELDSRLIHRLPESEEHLESLKQTIWERARTLELGGWARIETVDAWTAQRLTGGEGFAVIGWPPAEVEEVNLAVRKSFRRLLAEAGPRLRSRGAEARALVVIGPYGRMEDEGATTAMRGYDPTLYTGLEFVCLAADGRIKALMEAPVGA